MKIGHPKNFWGGVIFALIGLMFALIARGIPNSTLVAGYQMGTPARMGPGFFPFWLGAILFALGVLIAIIGMRTPGDAESGFPRFYWRPILFVLGAVVIFGVILKAVGMLIAGFVLVVIASIGSATFSLRRVVFLGIGLVTFCALVFVEGLKLPIPLCPDLESLQNVGMCRA